MPVPLFVCHANCCRSVLAKYLYEDLCPPAQALSAGIEVGFELNDKAEAMLRSWGIDARDHRPRQIDRTVCDRADAIFLMGPEFLRRLLDEYGLDLAAKAYLFADPFSLPTALGNHEYEVCDPSFDDRPTSELVREFTWFRERVVQIHEALHGKGKQLISAVRYLWVLGQ